MAWLFPHTPPTPPPNLIRNRSCCSPAVDASLPPAGCCLPARLPACLPPAGCCPPACLPVSHPRAAARPPACLSPTRGLLPVLLPPTRGLLPACLPPIQGLLPVLPPPTRGSCLPACPGRSPAAQPGRWKAGTGTGTKQRILPGCC